MRPKLRFLSDDLIKKIETVNGLSYERVGQLIKVNLLALKQTGDAANFVNKVKKACENLKMALVLMSNDSASLKDALEVCAKQKPLIYGADEKNISEFVNLAKTYKVPLVISASELEKIEELAQIASKEGVEDVILDTGKKSITKRACRRPTNFPALFGHSLGNASEFKEYAAYEGFSSKRCHMGWFWGRTYQFPYGGPIRPVGR